MSGKVYAFLVLCSTATILYMGFQNVAIISLLVHIFWLLACIKYTLRRRMGIYHFAVDYSRKEQMWAPRSFSDKCIFHPNHPLPNMIAMKNCQGSKFVIVS